MIDEDTAYLGGYFVDATTGKSRRLVAVGLDGSPILPRVISGLLCLPPVVLETPNHGQNTVSLSQCVELLQDSEKLVRIGPPGGFGQFADDLPHGSIEGFSIGMGRQGFEMARYHVDIASLNGAG